MKLWEKGYSTEDVVERFTVGNDRELDMHMARYDVQGSLAHAKMLCAVGILTEEERDAVVAELEVLAGEIEAGTFVIEEQFEDVHSKVEHELTARIGEAGKKIHTARSRNDQVLADLHLYAKAELVTVQGLVKTLFETLLELADRHKEVLLPGYTHTQIAMPSSFGLWFGAYAECLVDDVLQLKAAYATADQNPLGSAAGYGSSFPIDREMTTRELGFGTMRYNSVAAQMSRGRLEQRVAFAVSCVASTLAKLSADVCLYMSQNFGFLTFPKELTTGSSIMPHKQNPDVFELVRAKCNRLQAMPMQVGMTVNNLTSGYHRDFQELKGGMIQGIETIKECLDVTRFMLEQVVVKDGVVDDPMYDYLFSVEEVNRLVQQGVSFRDAYQKVGKVIMGGGFMPERALSHSHAGSIGNLCLEEIKLKMGKALTN